MRAPGKRTVITGGAGDLARDLVTYLSEHGFEVDAPGRERLDVTNAESVWEYFAHTEVDLLVCNAGIIRDQNIARLTESDWDEVMDVNFRGAVRCAQAVHQTMKGRGGGSIIMISSYSALHPPSGQTAYASAKAALLGLVAELARELGEDNIRINAILPGFLETKMTQSVRDQRKADVLNQHVLKRFNSGSEVAAFVRLLHEELIHTSGQVFQLDSRLTP